MEYMLRHLLLLTRVTAPYLSLYLASLALAQEWAAYPVAVVDRSRPHTSSESPHRARDTWPWLPARLQGQGNVCGQR